MKLARKFKRREVYIDVQNHKMHIEDIYEDVLQESFARRLLKTLNFWLYSLVVIIELFGTIINQNKWVAIICYQTLVYFAYLLYKHIKSVKEE